MTCETKCSSDDVPKLAAAEGGFTNFAAVSRVELKRDGKVVQVFDRSSLAQGKPGPVVRNVRLQPGDILMAPRAQ